VDRIDRIQCRPQSADLGHPVGPVSFCSIGQFPAYFKDRTAFHGLPARSRDGPNPKKRVGSPAGHGVAALAFSHSCAARGMAVKVVMGANA
jgi:hypothetical protein